MANRFRFFSDVFNEQANNTIKGFPRESLRDLFSFDDDEIYTIPIRHQYRPDLIAQQFYGNPLLFWVLVYVNNINDSPEGFYTGRQLRIPKFNRVLSVL